MTGEREYLRPLVNVALYAGPRCGQLLKLRWANVDFDVVKIKELMGHASIVTTMRYIHATDQGKRGAIVVLSEYQRHRRKFVAKEKRQTVQPAASR
jgi:integrase